jgi:hypothetical protein
MWGEEVQMFKVISLQTGETREVELIDLSHSLMLNSIVARGTPDGGLEHLGLITHQDLVFFTHTWGTWALEASETKPPEAVEALRLVGLWLEDPESVSDEELQAAAGAARAAWAAAGAAAGAARAAWAAARAARAAAGASWAAGAAGAARAATWAAEAATWAARAAAEAAAEADTYQKQGEFILDHLQKTSPGSFPFRRT